MAVDPQIDEWDHTHFGLVADLPHVLDEPYQDAVAENADTLVTMLKEATKAFDVVATDHRNQIIGDVGAKQRRDALLTTITKQLDQLDSDKAMFAGINREGLMIDRNKLAGELARRTEIPDDIEPAVEAINRGRTLDQLRALDPLSARAKLMEVAALKPPARGKFALQLEVHPVLRHAAHAGPLDGINAQDVADALDHHAQLHFPEHVRKIAAADATLNAFDFNSAMTRREMAKIGGVPADTLDRRRIVQAA